MPSDGRGNPALCNLADSFIYLSGGLNFRKNKTVASACRFSIQRRKWETLPDLNEARQLHSSCALGKEAVYVFCGTNTSNHINSIERLDT